VLVHVNPYAFVLYVNCVVGINKFIYIFANNANPLLLNYTFIVDIVAGVVTLLVIVAELNYYAYKFYITY